MQFIDEELAQRIARSLFPNNYSDGDTITTIFEALLNGEFHSVDHIVKTIMAAALSVKWNDVNLDEEIVRQNISNMFNLPQ